MIAKIDHIIYASPDLEEGMDFFEKQLGVRPIYGGQHIGRGTHNALLSLGKNIYLEIIAPDPAQKTTPLWMGMKHLTTAQLLTWAAQSNDLLELEKQAQIHQIPLGEIEEGSRTTATGNVLKWELTLPIEDNCSGVIPFFINWGKTVHPSQVLPKGGELVKLEIQHPEVTKVQKRMDGLGLNLRAEEGNAIALIATIRTLKGDLITIR